MRGDAVPEETARPADSPAFLIDSDLNCTPFFCVSLKVVFEEADTVPVLEAGAEGVFFCADAITLPLETGVFFCTDSFLGALIFDAARTPDDLPAILLDEDVVADLDDDFVFAKEALAVVVDPDLEDAVRVLDDDVAVFRAGALEAADFDPAGDPFFAAEVVPVFDTDFAERPFVGFFDLVVAMLPAPIQNKLNMLQAPLYRKYTMSCH